MDPTTQPQDQQATGNNTSTNAPALAQSVVQAAATVSPPPSIGIPTKTKEVGPLPQEFTAPIEVVGTDAIEKEPIPPEVASWMEKVNRGETGEKLQEVVIADKNTQTMGTGYAAAPVFILPLGEPQMRIGLHKSVSDSVRWLAEWCKRIVKKLGNQVSYQ